MTFAVILMFVEMGFLNGMYDNTRLWTAQRRPADRQRRQEAVIPCSRSRAGVSSRPAANRVAAAYSMRMEEMHCSEERP